MAKPDILALRSDDLAAWLAAQGLPPYRLEQILRWVYVARVESFAAMTNLPAELRQRLDDAFILSPLREITHATSSDGETTKFLFALADGNEIESVAMRQDDRPTFCISSQVGCGLACQFCATGTMGFVRDLTTAEILGQVTALARLHGDLRNIVFMGMGEPLLNLDAVLPALASLADEARFGLSPRRLSISTAGITPGIRRLAEFDVQPNLAISVNSPFNEQRSELMPINRTYPLAEVLAAARDYAERSGRRLMFEYVLVQDVNDSDLTAQALATLARNSGAMVNLIAFNPVEDSGLRPPSTEEIQRFHSVLTEAGVEVTQRFRRGREIAAGCGQLRAAHERRRPDADSPT